MLNRVELVGTQEGKEVRNDWMDGNHCGVNEADILKQLISS